jgi:hypothetical protein
MSVRQYYWAYTVLLLPVLVLRLSLNMGIIETLLFWQYKNVFLEKLNYMSTKHMSPMTTSLENLTGSKRISSNQGKDSNTTTPSPKRP